MQLILKLIPEIRILMLWMGRLIIPCSPIVAIPPFYSPYANDNRSVEKHISTRFHRYNPKKATHSIR